MTLKTYTFRGICGGLLLASGITCNVSHEAPPLVAESCASCHTADYQATTEPAHTSDPALYHQRCVDCHSSESWSPALPGPHPEERFTIKDLNHNYACLDCHSLERGGPSKAGADTDCVGCHLGAHSPTAALGRHRAIPSFKVEEYVPNEPPWCMECHDGGRGFGKAVPHPEEQFVIRRPPHNYECQECHDTTRGTTTEGNTNCTGCHDNGAHTQAAEAENHLAVVDYVFEPDDPAFCLDCHSETIPTLVQP
jgi:hypothetical protein